MTLDDFHQRTIVQEIGNAARETAADIAKAHAAPHLLLKAAVYPDGDQWCCLHGKNLMMGVAGFGPSPAAACAAFDKAWWGIT